MSQKTSLPQLQLVSYKPSQSVLLEMHITDLTGLTWHSIVSKARRPELVKARFLYCYFKYKYFDVSLEEIGRDLNRHHSTVINAIIQVNDHINSLDPSYDEFKEMFDRTELFITTHKIQRNANSSKFYSSTLRQRQAPVKLSHSKSPEFG